MKNITIAATIVVVCIAQGTHAQSFLDKAKQKAKNTINGATEKKAGIAAGPVNTAARGNQRLPFQLPEMIPHPMALLSLIIL